jgi:hypothetical protein
LNPVPTIATKHPESDTINKQNNKFIDTVSNTEANVIRQNMKTGKQTKYCLAFGLNKINPDVYNGSNGLLYGAVNDAKHITDYLKKEKEFDVVKLFTNEEASIQSFINA